MQLNAPFKLVFKTASKSSSDIFIKGASGEMEVLNWGGKVSAQEDLSLQKHALGNLLFSLSGIALAK